MLQVEKPLAHIYYGVALIDGDGSDFIRLDTSIQLSKIPRCPQDFIRREDI